MTIVLQVSKRDFDEQTFVLLSDVNRNPDGFGYRKDDGPIESSPSDWNVALSPSTIQALMKDMPKK